MGRSSIFEKIFGKKVEDAVYTKPGRPGTMPLTPEEKAQKQAELFNSLAHVTAVGKSISLIDAVRQNNETLVDEQLANGASPNTRDSDGHSALWNAIESMQPAIAEKLLNAGADPFFCDEKGDSLLARAAYNGEVDIGELLIEKGVKVNAANKNGDTALHMLGRIAADRNIIELAAMLLTNGAFIDARDNEGRTLEYDCIRTGGRKDSLLEYLAKAEKFATTKRAPPLGQEFLSGTTATVKTLKTVRFKPAKPQTPV